MSTVADVIAFLEKLAPPILAEDWDNVGLLVGRRGVAVQKVITCLTLTPDVAEEAVRQGVQLIVSHHPVLFRGAKSITDGTTEGRMLMQLIEHGVAVYSPHTCFDSAALGVNQQLALAFGLEEIASMRPGKHVEGLGSGRIGQLAEPAPLPDFLESVSSAIGANYVEFSGASDATVSRVGVACGSGGEFLEDAVQLGCDTFVTGEARFHSALEARSLGLNLILLGHYSSERPAVEQLADAISAEFPEFQSLPSQVETDPLAVFLS